MVFPQTPLIVAISLFLGGTWVDITADVYNRDKIAITWGRQDWASTPDPMRCPLTLNNGNSKAAPGILGRYSRRNPRSDLYGLLGLSTKVALDLTTPGGTVVGRFEGYITSWPTKWDVSGNDVYTTVTATGIRRRLLQGTKPLKDPLRRHIQAAGPLLYWPLTDGQSAREGTELVQGSQPIRSIGEAGNFYQGQPNWGKGSLAPWLDPVVELPVETGGLLTAYIPPKTITAWSFDHVLASGGPGNVTQLNLYDTGPQSDTIPQVEWDVIEWGSGGFNEVQVRVVERLESTSSTVLLTTISDPGIYDGGVHHLRLSVADDGAGGMTWELFIDGTSRASGTRPTAFRALSRVNARWSLVEGGGVTTQAVPMGHLTYWGANPPFAADTWRAVQGHNRELAGRRIERLCAEQNVPLTVNGNLDQTPAMGPQKPGAFLDLLQTAADVDGGTVYESRDTAGLAYRTRRSKYNQGV
ncbi:hypothetical protein [Streptomyces ipomoeae]|uniref:hypothetical protein n=1 Tax=Streptomyces ipomoeae TaxID=103232 RepID=UPI0029BD6B9C|nr:hypothetical protein [Streptomyces ipomoeae]MDX2692964.1 hypothetical protein [Streptomyces ipomoeae]MDX2840696.1 hypothetical protein [Streptomyces ipomoeae]